MKKAAIASVVLFSLSCASPAAAQSLHIDAAHLDAVGRVDPRFQSYNIEMAELTGGRFWAPFPRAGETAAAENKQPSGGLNVDPKLFRQRAPLDLGSRRLRNLARALGPAYIRVSGSWANSAFFQDNDAPPASEPPRGFHSVLTRSQWRGLIDFSRFVDGRIVTSFAVGAGARDANGVWQPDNTRRLLNYTRSIGGEVVAAELVNEPNLGAMGGLPAGYDGSMFAKDQAAFRAFAAAEAPTMRIVGPGSTGETGIPLFNAKRIPSEELLSAEPRPRFDIFSYHFYGARSQRCAQMAPGSGTAPADALGEAWLARTDAAFHFYRDLRDRVPPNAPIWVTETAQASCGGDRWASSFAETARYLDQLGRLARQGVSAVFHNTLAASDYGLLDEADWSPRPDYWAALLWRRLMGEVVLGITSPRPDLHIYAHCLRGSNGGVAVLVLNLGNTAASVSTGSDRALRYSLSADDFEGGSVRVNGREMHLGADDVVPAFKPISVLGNVSLAPSTSTFLALPGARNANCRLPS